MVVFGCHWLSVFVSGCQWVSDSVGVIRCVPVSAAASQCQKQPLFVDQRNLRKLNFSTLPPAAWLGRPPLRKTATFVESRRCVTTSPDAFCCILLHRKCTPIIVMSGEGEEGEEGGKPKDFFVLTAMRALLRPDLAFSLWCGTKRLGREGRDWPARLPGHHSNDPRKIRPPALRHKMPENSVLTEEL